MELQKLDKYENSSEDEEEDRKFGVNNDWKQMSDYRDVKFQNHNHKWAQFNCMPMNGIGVQNNSPCVWNHDGSKYAFVSGSYSLYICDRYTNEFSVLHGHLSPVHAVSFHPSRPLLVSSSDEGLYLWDTESGLILHKLPNNVASSKDTLHDAAVQCLCWGFDGRVLFSGSDDMTIICWRLVKSRLHFCEQITSHKARVSAISYHEQTHMLASASQDGIIACFEVSLLDTLLNEEAEAIITQPSHEVTKTNPEPPAYEGTKLNQKDMQMRRNIHHTASKVIQKYTIMAHRSGITCLSFTPCGRCIVSGAKDNTLRTWNVADGADLGEVASAKGDIISLHITDEKVCMITSDGIFTTWEYASVLANIVDDVIALESASMNRLEEELGEDNQEEKSNWKSWEGPRAAKVPVDIYSLDKPCLHGHIFDRNGSMDFVLSGAAQIHLWSWSDARLSLYKTISGHEEPLLLVIGTTDDNMISVDGHGHIVTHTEEGTISMHHDKDPVAAAGTMEMFAIVGGKHVGKVYVGSKLSLNLQGPLLRPLSVAVCSKQSIIAVSCSDYEVYIYQVNHVPEVERSKVNPIVSARVVPWQQDLTAPIFKVHAEDHTPSIFPTKSISTGTGHAYSLAFDSDGKRLAIGCNNHTVSILYGDNFKKSIKNISQHNSTITALLWVGNLLISGSGDGHIQCYDATRPKGNIIWTTKKAKNSLHQKGKILHLEEQDNIVYSASSDQTIIAWDVNTGNPIVSYSFLTDEGAVTSLACFEGKLVCGTEQGMIFQFPLANTDSNLFIPTGVVRK